MVTSKRTSNYQPKDAAKRSRRKITLHPGTIVTAFLKQHGSCTKAQLINAILQAGEVTNKITTATRNCNDAIANLQSLGMIQYDASKGDIYWLSNPIIVGEAVEKMNSLKEVLKKRKNEIDKNLRASRDKVMSSQSAPPALLSSSPHRKESLVKSSGGTRPISNTKTRRNYNAPRLQYSSNIRPQQVSYVKGQHPFCQTIKSRPHYVKNQQESDDPPSLVKLDDNKRKIPSSYHSMHKSVSVSPTYVKIQQGSEDDPPSLVILDEGNERIPPSHLMSKSVSSTFVKEPSLVDEGKKVRAPQVASMSKAYPRPVYHHGESKIHPRVKREEPQKTYPPQHPLIHQGFPSSVSYHNYPQYHAPVPCSDDDTEATSIMCPSTSSQKLTPSYPPNNDAHDGNMTMHHQHVPLLPQPHHPALITPQYSNVGADPYVLEQPLQNDSMSYYSSSTTTNSTSTGRTDYRPQPSSYHNYHREIAVPDYNQSSSIPIHQQNP